MIELSQKVFDKLIWSLHSHDLLISSTDGVLRICREAETKNWEIVVRIREIVRTEREYWLKMLNRKTNDIQTVVDFVKLCKYKVESNQVQCPEMWKAFRLAAMTVLTFEEVLTLIALEILNPWLEKTE